MLTGNSKVAARFLVHAELCRRMASETWSEDVAQELEQLADECARAAEDPKAEDAQSEDAEGEACASEHIDD
jgi:3-methyladenine DNA glycosylase AlkC